MAKRATTQDRPTTTTRLYAETVQILRMLAESKGMPMLDYVEQLALGAMEKDGPALIQFLQSRMGPARKDGRGKEGAK